MSLGTKIHRYQSWYGEKCPYTKPPIKIKTVNEEREFIPSISKGLATPQSHREIILGPKRERPHSAIRTSYSSSKAPVMPIRPTSGLRCRPNPATDPQRQDRESGKSLNEERILKIRFPHLFPIFLLNNSSQSGFGER
jgi:hypothetical protein